MGYYAQLNGTSGLGTVADDAVFNPGTGSYAVMFWAEGTDTDGGVFNHDTGGYVAGSWRIYVAGGTLYFNCKDTDGISATVSKASAFDGEFNHYAVVINKTTGVCTLYINDVAVATGDVSALTDITLATDLKIGYHMVGIDQIFWAGKFDDIRIYKGTDAEAAGLVSSVYKDGRGIVGAGTPVPAWRMSCDVYDGSIIQGFKSNGFELNGTISGGVTLVTGGVPFAVNEPVGETGKAMCALRDLIAESETLWTELALTGTDAEKIDAAKDSIYLTSYEPAGGTFVRPFVMITKSESCVADSIGTGSSISYCHKGELELRFEREIPAEHQDNSEEAEIDFLNYVESVMADCEALSGAPGYFMISGWDVIEGPYQFDPDRSEKFVYGIRIRVRWGLS